MSFNKAKEAHEKLMSERKEVSGINKYQVSLNKITPTTSNYDLIAATKTIQELVDKETPMKPRKTEHGDYLCGKCDDLVWEAYTSEKYERCSLRKCGQVVDWSDEE